MKNGMDTRRNKEMYDLLETFLFLPRLFGRFFRSLKTECFQIQIKRGTAGWARETA